MAGCAGEVVLAKCLFVAPDHCTDFGSCDTWASTAVAAAGVGQLRHGSEGWKCLETSMKALQQLMEGTGPAVAPLITDDVLDLLYRYA